MSEERQKKKKNGRQGEGGGRKEITLTPRQMEDVELMSMFLSLEQIAHHFGICENTFRSIRSRQPEVDLVYKRGAANKICAVAKSAYQKALEGDSKMIEFILKTQAGWKNSDNQETIINNYSGDIIHKIEFVSQDEEKN